MIRSGHIDSFTRDRLPPPEQMPDFSYDRPELTYPERLNAAAALLDVWRERGWDDRPCVIGNGDVWSYGRFRDTVDRIARLLTERFSIVPGNRVLVRGTNTPMLAACWLAVLKAGAVVVPTMPLLRATELESILERAAVSLALCDARFAKDLNAAAESMGGGMPVVTFNGGDLEGRLEETETGFAAVDTAADDVALIAFTSGTTGKPKATAHFHRDLLAVADLSPQSLLKTGGDDVFCGTPSLAFAYGQGGMLLFPLRVGASVVLLDRATPERLLEVTAKHKATVMFTVPTVYRAMTARIEEDPPLAEGLRTLRACVSAGEPLPATTLEGWQAVTGMEILDSFGTTEMLNAVLHSPPGAVRPGATGTVVPGYEARVVDDSLTPLPPGQIGRLAVRGPTGCIYLDDPRQENYVQGGWNLTGDAFRMDEDGYFWYHARTDDLIVSAGYKISGLEVEDVLLGHEAVEECAVIAAPDPLRGSIPKAFIVTRDGVRPSDDLAERLQCYVKDRIAPYKYPRAVEFLEQLPRTETGKIQRYKLRQREWVENED
ncbi:AMP-binding protein [Azospirillum argentinense]|uniref:2-aminobenzoate-CoA ligase n=1 Tax=Azospirillum argentinense TaxID=2970906 RepID=A0A2K1G6S5_9PROT|nr:AMP-binding protein [Azospirillum argentinense]MBK3797831.1 AMP-binding protein [Azospirillum argentinense]PNR00496.1 2-aminobenzoate-CoA ligase [Azospirillum argentinense]